MGKAKVIIRPTPMLRKQIGQMQKLLGVYSKKKVQDSEKILPEEPIHVQKEGIPVFLSQTRGVRSSHVTRRQFVLNRHFTEIISDVLATEFRHEISELGIQITSIETKAWNKGVSVFYTAKHDSNEETRKKLRALVAHLRSAITERRLIGRTPHINFIYDRSILIDQKLDDALSNVRIEEKNETSLMEPSSNQLHITKDLGTNEQKLISKRFAAPNDMDNTIFGLNYPLLYDEVALKLSRGRGEASRMTSTNFLASAKPLFRAPKEELNEIDPATRWIRMQKFIVSQKQKSLNLSRKKRLNEILSREATRPVVDDSIDGENGVHAKVTPDVDETSSCLNSDLEDSTDKESEQDSTTIGGSGI